MIWLATVFGDPDGLIAFEEDIVDSRINAGTARIQQDKLLDGTSYVRSHGTEAGDRRLEIVSKKNHTREQAENFWRLFSLNTKFLLSAGGRFYLGILSELDTDNGLFRFTFIPEQQFR